MEPEHDNDTVDKNVVIEDTTEEINGTVLIEIPSESPTDTNDNTAVDEVSIDPEQQQQHDTTEETSTILEDDQTAPTDESITAVSVVDTPGTESTDPMLGNSNKETVDEVQITTEQQQQQEEVLQTEDEITKLPEASEPVPTLPITLSKEQTAENSITPSTDVTEIQPSISTNKLVLSPEPKSPSPTRSSLSRKEGRNKHHKHVSFTGPKDTPVKPVSETRRQDWPLSADFSAELGEKAVGEYVRDKWSLSESWLHCVDYMGEQAPNRHRYRVKFSQPTRRRPIPAHTASVYFTLVLEGTGGQVGVWWVMEGQRTVHKPGEVPFREKWLKDILEAKSIICSETLF